MAIKLARRTVLKGLGGAIVGLPLLECMLNRHGTAFAQNAGELPKRYAIVFAGQALGGDDYERNTHRVNGGSTTTVEGNHIVPAESGSGYTITTPLRPLAARQGDFTLVSGMRIPYSLDSADVSAVPPAERSASSTAAARARSCPACGRPRATSERAASPPTR